MKKTTFAVAALLVAGTISMTGAADAQKAVAKKTAAPKTTAQKGEKPKASPGWVVIEEDLFFPLRLEPAATLHNARMRFRQREEKAAANELRKSESWLKFAASHALPMTKKSLDEAAQELGLVAADIEKGKLESARELDGAIAKAEHALAEWLYFKAKESVARNEEQFAARHLETASRYLRNAASSARYGYGDETVSIFDDIDKDGKLVTRGITIAPDRLAMNLTALEREITKLGSALKKAST